MGTAWVDHRGPAALLLFSVLLLAGCRTARPEVARLPVKHSVRSEQLQVVSDIELKKDHPLIQDLVQLRQDVAKELQLPLEGRDVVVYVFGDKARYQTYLDATYPGLPARRAYFVGTPRELAVYTFWGTSIQEDLRHEFTHGLLHAQLKEVPLWLDEGLAEYFEIPRSTPNAMHREYPRQLSTAIANGWQPDLERLESLQDVAQMQRADYQESWAWVHFLLHGSEDSRQVLLDYLQELRDNPHPTDDDIDRVPLASDRDAGRSDLGVEAAPFVDVDHDHAGRRRRPDDGADRAGPVAARKEPFQDRPELREPGHPEEVELLVAPVP